jgi:putative FmdB family regulatory protein
MPTFSYECPEGHEFDEFAFNWKAPNPACTKCGAATERVVRSNRHIPASVFPYTTTHLNGQAIEVKSSKHLEQLCKKYGKVHRPDAAWAEEHYEGYDLRSQSQSYSRGSGMGLPGCWA